MQDFIQMAVQQLGINDSTARSATGGLLGVLEKETGKGDFQSLLSKLPGAKDLISEGASGGKGGGGLLGSVVSSLGSSLGGGLGSALGVAGILKQVGLDGDKIAPFVGLFVNYLKDKVGPELLGRITNKIPELAKLAG